MNHEEIVSQRLKPKEVPDIRKKLLRSQRNICPLCGCIIQPEQAVLDHDHETGRVRTVLHRQCNQAEGRILNWASRTGQNTTPYQFLKRLVAYWEQDYEQNPLHPTYKSDIEQEVLRLKRKHKKLKSQKHKQRVRDEINAILENMK